MNLYSNFDRNQDLKCESFSSSETHGTIKLGFPKIVFKFAGCEENETINNYGGKQ